VVLTGRWATIAPGLAAPRDFAARLARADPAALARDGVGEADTGQLFAALDGTARELVTVMPPAALERRLDETRGARGLGVSGGVVSHPYEGYSRRLLRCDLPPDRLGLDDEPVLVLVEPSYLAAGCPEPGRWLAERRLTSDLALVALHDPAADERQRQAARALATTAGTSP